MEQHNNIKRLLSLLYQQKYLAPNEMHELGRWLSQLENDQTFEAWLQNNWQNSSDLPVDISMDEIRSLIRIKSGKKSSKTIILKYFQRIAAVLVVPLLIVSAVLVYQKISTPDNWVSLKTGKGERTHLTLPDGSEVWLNVDTELQYSVAFNQRNRNLKLNGEAFFKVAKNKINDFVVETDQFQVKAVGTEFGVNAYAGEPFAETYLKEGIVDVQLMTGTNEKIRMKPGQKSIVSTKTNGLTISDFQHGSESEWTGGHLVFQNEDIPRVFRKIERWFDVTIQYNPEEFSNETLYLNLKSGETLDKMLQIIDNAIGIQVKRNGNELLIEKKIKRANS